MTQQLSSIHAEQQEAMLSTNTDALAPATMPTIDAAGADDNSNSSADAEAMVAADARARELAGLMARAITREFDRTLEQLIRLRNTRYARAIKKLDAESELLAREYEQLEAGIQALESVIPSRERLVQHEVDELVVRGDPAAKQKFAELAEFKRKPVAMRERLGVIRDRFQSINQEKCDIARTIFNEWHSNAVQPIIRAAERGLFVTLLNGLEQSFYEFQTRTGTGMSDNRQRPLLHQGHFSSLTADGRSAEWVAGHKWYG